MSEQRRICDLRSLAEGRPGLTAAKGASLAEAASVCLESRGHEAVGGTLLQLHDESEDEEILVHWSPAEVQHRRTYADMAEATEDGACAVAFSLLELTRDMVVLERSRKRTAFDYWLGDRSDPGPLFQHKTRLEVTGILEGDETRIDTRLQQKLERLERYPNRLPAIVAVVEFGTPLAKIQEK